MNGSTPSLRIPTTKAVTGFRRALELLAGRVDRCGLISLLSKYPQRYTFEKY